MTMIPPSLPPAHASRRTLGELLGVPTSDEQSAAATGPSMPLPLRGVSARVSIVGDCALTELTERYANPHDVPLDVTHTIPLPAGCAVIGVEVRAADRVVRGRCLRTDAAKRTFEDAKARGKTAALVLHVRDDVHEISLGNVPPRTEVTVTLRLVERLRVDAGRFEYRLPTAISPKFVPGTPVGHEGSGWSPDTTHAPDASRLTPPILLAGRIPLELQVTMAAGATDIQATLALERTDRDDGMTVLRPAAAASCDGDVVLRFWTRASTAELRAYTDGSRTLVVLDPPAERRPQLEQPREAVYVLDRSGSMKGERIAAAKRAIAASIKRLSPCDRLQVIAFHGSLVRSSDRPVDATPEAVAAALTWLDAIEASGGTLAMPALREACTTPVAAGCVRTVLFVTDGAVADDVQILALASEFDPAARVFTVGVGRGTSSALLERLARVGGGSHVAIVNTHDIEAEIERFDACMHGPMACGVHEACNDSSPRTDLFAGRAATFLVDGGRSRIRVESIDGRFAGECSVLPSPMPLGPVWARAEVERLEDRRIADPASVEAIDERIAALGIEHQIQTRLTAFVAVDEASQVHGEALEVVQPVQVPADAGLDNHAQWSCALRMHWSPGDVGDARDHTVHYSRPSRAPAFLERLNHRVPAPRRQLPQNPAEWLSRPGIDEADLREGLAALERTQGIVTHGVGVPMDPTLALTVLIMLESCRTSRLRGRVLPPELQGIDLSRRGRLWKHCRRCVEALREHPGWPRLERALRARNISELVAAAASVVGPRGALPHGSQGCAEQVHPL